MSDASNTPQPEAEQHHPGRSPLVSWLLVVVAAIVLYGTSYGALRATGVINDPGWYEDEDPMPRMYLPYFASPNLSQFFPHCPKIAKLYWPLIQIESQLKR